MCTTAVFLGTQSGMRVSTLESSRGFQIAEAGNCAMRQSLPQGPARCQPPPAVGIMWSLVLLLGGGPRKGWWQMETDYLSPRWMQSSWYPGKIIALILESPSRLCHQGVCGVLLTKGDWQHFFSSTSDFVIWDKKWEGLLLPEGRTKELGQAQQQFCYFSLIDLWVSPITQSIQFLWVAGVCVRDTGWARHWNVCGWSWPWSVEADQVWCKTWPIAAWTMHHMHLVCALFFPIRWAYGLAISLLEQGM